RLGRIRFLLAQAHIGITQPDRAAPLLADARAHFEAVNDGAMLAEGLGAQAVVPAMTQAKDAVFLAAMALSGCRRLKPVPAPTEARLLGVLGDALFGNRDWDRAMAAYDESIEVGSAFSDLRRAARMYAGLSTAYRDAGEVETAARYAGRSA